MGNVKGVGVDKDATPLNDPVTVLVTPAGNEIDADDWSHANNLIATGCSFKEGYPTHPGDEPTGKAKASGGSSGSSSSGGSASKADDKAVAQG